MDEKSDEELTAADVEVVSTDSPFRGHFRIDRHRLRHRLFAGGWSPVLTREVFERGHAAAALPYDPVSDRVILIRQFRMGAMAAGMGPWLWEAVAGVIDAGETAEEAATRELYEEIGLRTQELVPIGRMLVSPGASSETVTMFCARVSIQGERWWSGKADEGEDILVRALPREDFSCMVADGGIDNSTTLVLAQWFLLNHAKLAQRWAGQVDQARSGG